MTTPEEIARETEVACHRLRDEQGTLSVHTDRVGAICSSCFTSALAASEQRGKLNSEALTAIVGEHERDHKEGNVPRHGCTGCAMVLHLERLEQRVENLLTEKWAYVEENRELVSKYDRYEQDKARLEASERALKRVRDHATVREIIRSRCWAMVHEPSVYDDTAKAIAALASPGSRQCSVSFAHPAHDTCKGIPFSPGSPQEKGK